MPLRGKKIAFALPEGHFSMPAILTEIHKLAAAGAKLYPFFLATTDHPETDNQFQKTKKTLEQITGREMLETSLAEAADLTADDTSFDIMVIAPCPGNFLAKLVNTRTTSVALSKPVRYLQSGKPVVLALVANGDSENLLENIRQIISLKSIFLVPFGPVEQKGKQIYLSRLDLLFDTVIYAMEQKQLEPVFLEPCWLPN